MEKNSDEYLRLDCLSNAVDSLLLIKSILNNNDIKKLKWAVLAIHHALYLFCVECLRGTDSQKVMDRKKNQEEKKERIIGFWDALKRVQGRGEFNPPYTNSKPLKLSRAEKDSIKKICNFRNIILHFIPTHYSWDSSEIKEYIVNVIEVIFRLINESGQIHFYHSGHYKKKEIAELLMQIKEQLNK